MTYSIPCIAKITATTLLVGILIQILYDPISSAKHALEVSSVCDQLPQARDKWDALEITDYTFEIIGDARSICLPSARIEVQNSHRKTQLRRFSHQINGLTLIGAMKFSCATTTTSPFHKSSIWWNRLYKTFHLPSCKRTLILLMDTLPILVMAFTMVSDC